MNETIIKSGTPVIHIPSDFETHVLGHRHWAGGKLQYYIHRDLLIAEIKSGEDYWVDADTVKLIEEEEK